MARYRWLVFTNCTPGREAAFERWYDEVHIPDLLRIPGIVKVARARVADVQLGTRDDGTLEPRGAEHVRFRYVTTYHFETDDPGAVLDEVSARANTPQMEITPDLSDVYTALFEDL